MNWGLRMKITFKLGTQIFEILPKMFSRIFLSLPLTFPIYLIIYQYTKYHQSTGNMTFRLLTSKIDVLPISQYFPCSALKHNLLILITFNISLDPSMPPGLCDLDTLIVDIRGEELAPNITIRADVNFVDLHSFVEGPKF